jgi:uncharacterized protein (TIGR00290 family)
MWSGGKDCHYALYRAIQAGLECRTLLVFIDADTELVMSHRFPPELIEEQARLIGLPVMKVRATSQTYDRELKNVLFDLRSEGITRGIFGGSNRRDHRDWYETIISDFDMRAVFPLWGIPSHLLVEQQRKIMTSTIVQIDRTLSESYLGRDVSNEFIEYLHDQGIDPAGGKGEYHTFVRKSPLMDGEIILTHAERRATPQAVSLEIDYWKVEREP